MSGEYFKDAWKLEHQWKDIPNLRIGAELIGQKQEEHQIAILQIGQEGSSTFKFDL